MSETHIINVLIADDDPGDVLLIRESLKESKLHINIHHVPDGVQCLEFLEKKEKFADAPKIDLLMLDLNMPRMNGRDVLKIIREKESLKKLPIVILSTSDAENDVSATYAMGVNCYITKPVDLLQFRKVVNEITDFWFTVVKLPNGKQ